MCSRPVIQRFALHGQHLTNVKVITLALFQVPVSPYLSQCVTDTCGCNVSIPFPLPTAIRRAILNYLLITRLGAIASASVLQWQPTPLPALKQELLSSESSFFPLLDLRYWPDVKPINSSTRLLIKGGEPRPCVPYNVPTGRPTPNADQLVPQRLATTWPPMSAKHCFACESSFAKESLDQKSTPSHSGKSLAWRAVCQIPVLLIWLVTTSLLYLFCTCFIETISGTSK